MALGKVGILVRRAGGDFLLCALGKNWQAALEPLCEDRASWKELVLYRCMLTTPCRD